MQAKYDLMTSTPLDVIVNAARDMLNTDGDKKKPANTAQPSQTGTKEEDLPWNYKTVNT